jgi:hypothetical protein
MKTRVKLKPGAKGTKKLAAEYGNSLVCIRYRYDATTRKRYKTVEIIVSESDWSPPPAKHSDGTLVQLKIGIKETASQEEVRAVGGRWDRQKQVWVVPYGCIAGTKLEKFIVLETVKKGAKKLSLYMYKLPGKPKKG